MFISYFISATNSLSISLLNRESHQLLPNDVYELVNSINSLISLLRKQCRQLRNYGFKMVQIWFWSSDPSYGVGSHWSFGQWGETFEDFNCFVETAALHARVNHTTVRDSVGQTTLLLHLIPDLENLRDSRTLTHQVAITWLINQLSNRWIDAEVINW